MYEDSDSSTALPKGLDNVPIPLTLEVPRVNGAQRYRNRLYLATGMGIILVVFSFSIFFMGVSWFLKPLIFLGVLAVGAVAIRYLILEERAYRVDYRRHFLQDFRLSTRDIWGIYHVDQMYPHLVHFRNNRTGMFVLFEKNVRVGRDTVDHHYKHYEAVASAYRVAGSHGLTVVHIDQMVDVGVDTRIDGLFEGLTSCSNSDVRDILVEVYSNLRMNAQFSTSAQDVFLLSTKGSPEDLLEGFESFKSNLIGQANYVTFRIFAQEDIRQLTKDLFNMEEFSATQANVNSIEHGLVKIQPLRLISPDGSIEDLRPVVATPPQRSKVPARRSSK